MPEPACSQVPRFWDTDLWSALRSTANDKTAKLSHHRTPRICSKLNTFEDAVCAILQMAIENATVPPFKFYDLAAPDLHGSVAAGNRTAIAFARG